MCRSGVAKGVASLRRPAPVVGDPRARARIPCPLRLRRRRSNRQRWPTLIAHLNAHRLSEMASPPNRSAASRKNAAPRTTARHCRDRAGCTHRVRFGHGPGGAEHPGARDDMSRPRPPGESGHQHPTSDPRMMQRRLAPCTCVLDPMPVSFSARVPGCPGIGVHEMPLEATPIAGAGDAVSMCLDHAQRGMYIFCHAPRTAQRQVRRLKPAATALLYCAYVGPNFDSRWHSSGLMTAMVTPARAGHLDDWRGQRTNRRAADSSW